MKPSDIGKAYNQITDLWEGEDFNKNNGIEEHKRAIAFIHNKGKALDVGCGCTGRIIDLMIEAGFSPEGVDISDAMITLAREKHPQIIFHQQDICQWKMNEKYDLISAWDSIWHLPLNQQSIVLTKLVNALNMGGVLIFSFGGADQEGEHTNNSMGPEIYYSSLGVNGFLKILLELGCSIRHLEYDQYPELHAYLIVQKDSND